MICGLFYDEEGVVHLCERASDGTSRDKNDTEFRPFLWTPAGQENDGGEAVVLNGSSELNVLTYYSQADVYRKAAADRERGAEAIKPVESQYLIHHKARCFEGATFGELRRMTIEISTDLVGDEERIDAMAVIVPQGASQTFVADVASGSSEKAMLTAFSQLVGETDPDVIEGHNTFAHLDLLMRRMRRHRLTTKLGRFGYNATARKSRMKIAERWIDYTRADVPGRAVFDASLATQLYDVTARELPGYELEDVAGYFEVPGADKEEPENEAPRDAALRRVQLARAVADILLPTYFAQTQNLPMPLQDACLRGSSGKVDLLLFERYYHARQALPGYPPGAPFEGAFSKSFETGVFHDVTHYDVASLYPSLLLSMNRAPLGDTLGAFLPLLGELRALRLEYKKMAKEATDPELRTLYGARQQSFKILINSFYGYLGFPQARFADPALAAEVTRRGRELIQNLIERFQSIGCKVLEADTDGIYLVSEAYRDNPEALLAKVSDLLPEGVSLEFDGSYKAMFSYKAKNYALLDGEKIHLKGSAFRSRGMEPFLGKLTLHLIRSLLGVEPRPIVEAVAECRALIASGKADVHELARSEYLSMNPEAYRRKIEEGGKPRRASLEVALRMNPFPAMGRRVSYYILPKEKGLTSDWQRARPLSDYDPAAAPYAADYYLGKLADWEERYAAFLGDTSGHQDELPL